MTYADVEFDSYRLQLKDWLAAHLERRLPGDPIGPFEISHYTPEVLSRARDIQRTLCEGGYAGITWPIAYGGRGLTPMHQRIFDEETAGYVLPDFGVLSGTTFRVCVPTMIAHADGELLADIVPRVLRGEALFCQFFSEPVAGSDLAGIQTRATKDGDTWVLHGQKVWSTFAHLADWGMCLTRTDWDVPKHKGLTWFAVPCDSPGLAIRPIKQMSGSSRFCEDFFDDVVVPDRYRIGDLHNGWSVTQTMLVFERGASRSDAGTAQPLAAGPLAPDLVAIAKRAGRTGEPVVRQKVAQAHITDFVGRALAARISGLAKLGKLNPGVAAYGKLFRGTYTPVRARYGIEVGQGSALAWDPTVEEDQDVANRYLNGRVPAIAGGTNEMQRNAIGERVLGLPREPSFDFDKPFRQVLRDARNWSGQPG